MTSALLSGLVCAKCGREFDESNRLLLTVHHKPKEHRLEDGVAPTGRGMSQLGG